MRKTANVNAALAAATCALLGTSAVVQADEGVWEMDAALLYYGETKSDGMFDITSGVLRKVWKFDGSDNLPTPDAVKVLIAHIGWRKVKYTQSSITLAKGMELDFGGIGKEYAVDCVAKLCAESAPTTSIVVNFGGDIQVTRPRPNKQPWHIGIENPEDDNSTTTKVLKIISGGCKALSIKSRQTLQSYS
jgi:thiamine biosynthesis lipoprotein ApbE